MFNKGYFEKLKQHLGITENLDLSEYGVKAGLSKIVKDAAHEMLPAVSERLHCKSDNLTHRLTSVGMIEHPEVNGFVKTADNWRTFEIFLNVGLMMFFHKISKMFASRIGVMGQDMNPSEHPSIPYEEMVRVAKKLMESFWSNNLLNTVGFYSIQLSLNQNIFAGILLHFAEKFVVAHELGHVTINLSPQYPSEYEYALTLLNDIHIEAFQRDVEQWAEEIASDLIGLQLTVSTENDDIQRMKALLGAEFVFIVQNMLEQYFEKKFRENPPIGTHPPSKLRLALIRKAVGQSNPEGVFQVGKALESMADDIISKI